MPTREELEIKRAQLRSQFVVPLEESPVLPFSISIEGLDGTGKTTFIIGSEKIVGMPTPIVHVNFSDRSCIPMLYALPKARRDLIQPYDIKPSSPDGSI